MVVMYSCSISKVLIQFQHQLSVVTKMLNHGFELYFRGGLLHLSSQSFPYLDTSCHWAFQVQLIVPQPVSVQYPFEDDSM